MLLLSGSSWFSSFFRSFLSRHFARTVVVVGIFRVGFNPLALTIADASTVFGLKLDSLERERGSPPVASPPSLPLWSLISMDDDDDEGPLLVANFGSSPKLDILLNKTLVRLGRGDPCLALVGEAPGD